MKKNKRQEKTALTPALPPVAAMLLTPNISMKYNSGAYFRSLITNCQNASGPAQYLDEDQKRLSDLLECWSELSEYCYAIYSAGQLINPLFYNNVNAVNPINEEIPILELLGACSKCLTDWGTWRGNPFTCMYDFYTFLTRWLTNPDYKSNPYAPDSTQMAELRDECKSRVERIKKGAGLIAAQPEIPAEAPKIPKPPDGYEWLDNEKKILKALYKTSLSGKELAKNIGLSYDTTKKYLYKAKPLRTSRIILLNRALHGGYYRKDAPPE